MSEAVASETPPTVSHVDALPPGTRLAEFEIVGLLGVGGFGMVYRAFDHSLHRAVAIKEYLPSAMAGRAQSQALTIKSSADEVSFKAGLQSFVAEARLLAQFDHPSLVKVFRFWEENNTAYMVMPLYSGMTLKQARSQMRTPPTEAWLRKVLWSMLGALRTLHDGSTMHRDVSPDNIFVQDLGPPVLLDLGAARIAISDNSLRKHTAVLKVNYAPIEQYADVDDMPQGPWTDLYSLAAVVHNCLSNIDPLPSTFRVLKDRMRTCVEVGATLEEQLGLRYSPEFLSAIDKALAIRPEERLQSIDAFAEAMKLVAPAEGLSAFDWRAELGDIWQGANSVSGKIHISPTVNTETAVVPQASNPQSDFSQTLPQAPLEEPVTKGSTKKPRSGGSRVKSSHGGESRPLLGPGSRKNEAEAQRHREAKAERLSATRRRRSSVPWAGLLLGVLVLASAAYAMVAVKSRDKARRDDAVITEMAERPVASPAAAVAPAISDGTATVPVAGAADMPPSAAIADLTRAPVATTPATAASIAVSTALAPAPAISPSAASTAQRAAAIRTARVPLPPMLSVNPALPAVVPAPAPLPAPPAVRAAELPRPAPTAMCADANFFMRPMCMHQECQKASLSRTAVCIDFRRKLEESRTREP